MKPEYILRNILLTTFVLLAGLMAYGQQSITATGIIIGLADKNPIEKVHIINMTTHVITTSNNHGEFRLPVKNTDTIRCSAIGFKTLNIVVSDSSFTSKGHLAIISLEKKIYEMEAVVVKKSFKTFKREFLEMDLIHDENEITLNLPKVESMPSTNADGSMGVGLVVGSPITALYNKFSKEAKFKRHYNKLVQQDEFRERLAARYNTEVVTHLTKLEDLEVIKKFMAFCDLSDNFIDTADDYELLAAIVECYDEFSLRN